MRLALLLLAFAPQADRQRPVVAGFERFGAEIDPAESGRLLIGELNCAACHRAEGAGKRAPILTDAGSRLKPDWLRAWLADPHKVKPGTTMPHLLAGADPKGVIEPLVHYVMSLRGDRPFERWGGSMQKEREAYKQTGCLACHGPLTGPDARGDAPLGNLNAKYSSAEALAHFLHDPLKWRPSGRMPKMNLTHAEAMAIATQVVGLPPRAADDPGETVPDLAYESFEGHWNKCPDFDSLKPVATGTTKVFDVKLAKKEDNIGLRFRGYIDIPKDGLYTFYTGSDDGSRLLLGTTLVVNNDGIHGGTEVAGSIELKKGRHALTVEWFEAQGGEELSVHYEGPGFSKRKIPPEALSHSRSGKLAIRETRAADGFVPDPALAKQGAALFIKSGCMACHHAGKPDAGALQGPPLANAKSPGCLDGKPVQYGLDAKQTAAIRAALARPNAPVDPMLALNCYACHARGKRGGPEEARKAHFVTTDPTAGDEGRLPPTLHDAGAKLKRAWLQTVLNDGTKVRPYMLSRMPAFGAANVAGLAEYFEKADSGAADPPPSARDRKFINAGHLLTGSKGMQCITCHTFQGHKAQGIQAMDLIHMPTRLRRDWFDRYMLEPLALRPGTRMPSFWPEGRSARKDILEGNTPQQIDAIWQYLSEGAGARVPAGLGHAEILLAPKDEAVLYRNFIQGAGPRAIAVGYPERAHLAFDANQMRLAMIWQGDFIDASKHWVDRGSGFQKPAGENVVSFPEGPPFAVLPDAKAPWPKVAGKEAGYAFEGYELDKQRRPTFMYSFGGVQVRDFFEARPGQEVGTFRRTLSFESKQPPGNLYFRRDAKVILPVRFSGGKASIVVEYAW